MKNNSLIRMACWVALVLGLPFISVAQSTYGLQAGLHLSGATIEGPTPYVPSAQGNYFLGLQARHPLNRRWAISSDVQFTKRGFFLNQVRSVSENRLGFQLLYLDLASRIEYTVFQNIGLQLGAYTGYRLAEYDQVVGSDQWVKAVFPATDTWDVGLQGGIIAHFQRWSAFARYTHSVKPVVRLVVTDEDELIKIYHRGLQMGVSYDIFNR